MPLIQEGVDLPATESMPKMGQHTEWLLRSFYDLHGERSMGMSAPNPISASMCTDYAIIMGIQDVRFFYKAMKQADAVWFKHKVK